MSKYFDALRRLEKRNESPRRRASRSSKQAEPSLEASPRVISFPDSPLTNEQEAAYATLLDSLRTSASPSGTPVVVLAGLTSAEAIHSVVAGLAAHAGRRGLQMLAAQLRVSPPRRVLEAHRSVPAGSQRAFPLELAGSNDEDLATLSKELKGREDLVVVEAPPILQSAEAALLARACDGLVLVVQPGVTATRSLRVARGCAKRAGCTILGVVVHESRSWVPLWLRRLIPDPLINQGPASR